MKFNRGESATFSFSFPHATGALSSFLSKDGHDALATVNIPVFINHDLWSIKLTDEELDCGRATCAFCDTAGKTISFDGSAKTPVMVVTPPLPEGFTETMDKLLEEIHGIKKSVGPLPEPTSVAPTAKEIADEMSERIKPVFDQISMQEAAYEELKKELELKSTHKDPTPAIEELTNRIDEAFKAQTDEINSIIEARYKRLFESLQVYLEGVITRLDQQAKKIDKLSTFDPKTQEVIAKNMRGTEFALTQPPDFGKLLTQLEALVNAQNLLIEERINEKIGGTATKGAVSDMSTSLHHLVQEILAKV